MAPAPFHRRSEYVVIVRPGLGKMESHRREKRAVSSKHSGTRPMLDNNRTERSRWRADVRMVVKSQKQVLISELFGVAELV